MENFRNFKEKSFMVDHWMNCHGMSTAPPEFKFRLVNVHKEALSRQLDEAVHIRSIGNLNKKMSLLSMN